MEWIRTEKKLCTCCMEEHEVKVVHILETTVFKKTELEYTAEYFYCDIAEELYMDEVFMASNDIRMKDAYRKAKGLLTTQEIRDIRSQYGITQTDLCVLLGWGGKTITRYEGHQVQDKAQDAILKKLNHDPEWFLNLLIETKNAFSMEIFRKYYNMALLLYEKKQDEYLRKSITAKYARYSENALYNGNMGLNLNKVVDIICYLSNSNYVTNLYKVKLMKLMWYIDFLSYKLRDYAMTGLVYQALPMGAVPVGHDSLIHLKGVVYEEIEIGDGMAYRFCESERQEYLFLSEEDKIIIDVVIRKLGKMSKDEIVTFMHKERAFQETVQREIILYRYAEFLQI